MRLAQEGANHAQGNGVAFVRFRWEKVWSYIYRLVGNGIRKEREKCICCVKRAGILGTDAEMESTSALFAFRSFC